MAQQGFDISKYITATDIVSAVTAGTIAYLTYKTKQDEPKPEQPQGQQATSQGQQPAPQSQPTTAPQPSAAQNPTPKLSYGFDDRMSPEQMMLSTQNFENAASNAVDSLNLPKSVSARLTDALFKIRSQCGDNEILHQLLDDPAKLKILSANLPRSTFSLEGNVFINNLVKQLKGGADLVQASRMARRAIGY